MDQLFSMKIFCQIIDSGSMANAARTLGLAPATVTGALTRIEKQLGVRLLDRTTRRINITEAGQVWYDHATRMMEQSAAADDAVRSLAGEPRGALRVTLALGVGMTFIYPHLHEFSLACPGINLDLQVSDRIVDLIENRCDLALRVGRAKDSDLIHRPLLRYRRVTCASSAYLAEHGMPLQPSDLVSHDCLLYRHDPQPSDWEYSIDGALAKIRVRGRYASNESNALLAWARSGLGITRQPTWLVDADLRSGALVRVLDDYAVTKTNELPGIYALLPKSRQYPKKVEVFLEFFGQKMTEHQNAGANFAMTA